MKKIFGVENWVPSTQFYFQKANLEPEIAPDSFYDARSDGSSNDDENVHYLSFPGFSKSSTDDDEMADVEIFQETDNNFPPDGSKQREVLPIFVSPDCRMFNCGSESTFPGFLEICSTVHISPIIDHTDKNDEKQRKTGNNQSLRDQSFYKRTVEANKHPVPRNGFCSARSSLKAIVAYTNNLCPEVATRCSSKQVIPLNKKNSRLSLNFDSKAFFQTPMNMQCSEYWNTIESYIPPEKKRRLLSISRNRARVPNQPLCPKSIAKNDDWNKMDYYDEINKRFTPIGEENDKVSDGIKIESRKFSNKLQYAEYTVSNNDSTENEESLDECEAESEESDVEINNNSFETKLPKVTLNSTFCVEDRNSKGEANPNGSNNDKKSDNFRSKTNIDFFPENKPIVLEYIDYETSKVDTLIAYPVVCLETIKSQKSGHLTKQEMVKRLIEISILTCEKPIGIIHGVKDMLSSHENKLQEKIINIDTVETNDQNQLYAPLKTIRDSNTVSLIKTPCTKKSIKSKIPCSIKSKEDVAKRKAKSEECVSEIKTPFPLKCSQSNISTNTYVKGSRRMLPLKGDFLVTTQKSTTFTRKIGNREEIISSNFKSFFRAFAKLGNRLKSGAAITKTNSNFWLKKTGVVCDKESVKMADEYFSEIAGRKLVLNISDYIQYLITISRIKRTTLCNLINQLKRINISEITHTKRILSLEDNSISSKATSSPQLLRKKLSTPKANAKISSLSKIPVSSTKAKNDLNL